MVVFVCDSKIAYIRKGISLDLQTQLQELKTSTQAKLAEMRVNTSKELQELRVLQFG